MASSHQLLLTLGGVFLLGLVTATVGRRTALPRVTLLVLFGVTIGDSGFALIPQAVGDLFPTVADMAMVMVGFLLGGQLTPRMLRNARTEVLAVSLVAALVTAVLVAGGLRALAVPWPVALLLGCIASATDATAVFDVVQEADGDSRFGRRLLAIVALDDVWALLLFSAGMALVTVLTGAGGEHGFLGEALREVVGAVLIGAVLGVPAAYLTGRAKPGQPIVTEAVGLVFLCGGLALWAGVSFLIAAVTLGAVIANLARHHAYPFHAIENVEEPVLVLFFVLAGASLELGELARLGLPGLAYVLLRAAGKIAGARIGGAVAGMPAKAAGRLGLALLPQAGVAIGMGLVAVNQFPESRSLLLPLVIGSTVLFELLGPVGTRLAVRHGSREECVNDG